MADDRALPAFTLFTITYQRTAELVRLFASLCRQTCKEFVWLIVSDETNDATRQAVDRAGGLRHLLCGADAWGQDACHA